MKMSQGNGFLLSLSLMRAIIMRKKTKMKATIKIIKDLNIKTMNLSLLMHS